MVSGNVLTENLQYNNNCGLFYLFLYSIHPTLPILATCSGQRRYPLPEYCCDEEEVNNGSWTGEIAMRNLEVEFGKETNQVLIA